MSPMGLDLSSFHIDSVEIQWFRLLSFRMCVLGKRLLKDLDVMKDCNKNLDGPLHNLYCKNEKCDQYYLDNNVTIRNGIRGLASGVFFGE